MKRPAFQFYPADWTGNTKLRRCSIAAHGAWIGVLCLMHDSDEYGVLRWPLREIAETAKATFKLLRELVDKGVLKGSDKAVEAFMHTPNHGGRLQDQVTLIAASAGPCWYSSRMVRDEWARQHRGIGTRFGNNGPPNQPGNEPGNLPHNLPDKNTRQGEPPSQLTSRITTRRDVSGASSSSSLIPPVVLGTLEGAVDKSKPNGDKSPQDPNQRQWWKTPQGIEAKAKELGVTAQPGGNHDRLKERCFEEIAKRQRGDA